MHLVLLIVADTYIAINKEASSRYKKKKSTFDISRKCCYDTKYLFDEDYSETGHHSKRQLVTNFSDKLRYCKLPKTSCQKHGHCISEGTSSSMAL
jgi:hypothetical protein